MTIKSILRVAFTCLFVTSFNANAALIDNGNTTIDNGTNLEWLDLTLTFSGGLDGGVTVNDLNNGFGGYFDAGYRHATEAELLNLWSNVGLTGDGEFKAEYISGALTMYDLLGKARDDYQRGIYQYDVGGNVAYNLADIQLSTTFTESGAIDQILSARSVIQVGGANLDLGIFWQQPDFAGHYLVRSVSVVPVPAAVWLFGSGLLGLIGVARRKKA